MEHRPNDHDRPAMTPRDLPRGAFGATVPVPEDEEDDE